MSWTNWPECSRCVAFACLSRCWRSGSPSPQEPQSRPRVAHRQPPQVVAAGLNRHPERPGGAAGLLRPPRTTRGAC
eukprot:6322076-Pyramimonas_sp.AAC.1